MKSHANEKFWKAFENLPAQIQRRAREAYRLWQAGNFGWTFEFVDFLCFGIFERFNHAIRLWRNILKVKNLLSQRLNLIESKTAFCFNFHSNLNLFARCNLTTPALAVSTLFLFIFIKVSPNKSDRSFLKDLGYLNPFA